MIIIGVDPGKGGGIVALDRNGVIVEHHIMPLTPMKEVDALWLFSLFKKYQNTTVFVEKVGAMPGNGGVSMFNFGQAFASVKAACQIAEISWHLVTPQAWQKVIHEGMNKKIPAKERSLAVFQQAYPGLDLRPTVRAKKPHDGKIDALHIAEYGRQKLLGKMK